MNPWVPLLVAVLGYFLTERAKTRERRLALKKETYMTVWSAWKLTEMKARDLPLNLLSEIRITGSGLSQEEHVVAFQRALDEVALSMEKLWLTAPPDLLKYLKTLGKLYHNHSVDLIIHASEYIWDWKDHGSSEEKTHALNEFIGAAFKCTLGLQRATVAARVMMRDELAEENDGWFLRCIKSLFDERDYEAEKAQFQRMLEDVAAEQESFFQAVLKKRNVNPVPLLS